MSSCWRFFLMALLMVAAVSPLIIGVAEGSCQYLSRMTGGCPNKKACRHTCSSCYVGIGKIEFECIEPSAITLPEWECRCYFTNGAPCPPPMKNGSKPCPLP